MVPRLVLLTLGTLLCSVVVAPLVGDPSTLTWFMLIVLAAAGLPLSAWATVRLVWPARSPAAAWAAVAAALVVQVGLIAGAFVEHNLNPRDIGTAVGKLFRGEGMAPGGVTAARLGASLKFVWVKPIATEAHDRVDQVVQGGDDLLWAAGVSGAALDRPGEGKLWFYGYDEQGELVRSHPFDLQGSAEVVALHANAEGEVTAVVRSRAGIRMGEVTRGASDDPTTLVLSLDTDGKPRFSSALPLQGAVASFDEQGFITLAGRTVTKKTAADERGVVIQRLDREGDTLVSKRLEAVRAEATSLTLTSTSILLTLKAPDEGALFKAAGESFAFEGEPRTALVVLDKERLADTSVVELGTWISVDRQGTRALSDDDLLLALRLEGGAKTESRILGQIAPQTGAFTTVMLRTSSKGEERWRASFGNPPNVTPSGDQVQQRVAVVLDDNGLIALSGHTRGFQAGESVIPATVIPGTSATKPNEPHGDGIAVRISTSGLIGWAAALGGAGRESFSCAAPADAGRMVIGGSYIGPTDLADYVLPGVGEGDASKGRAHAFIGVARIE